MSSLPSKKLTKPTKVTRAQIQDKLETVSDNDTKSNKSVTEEPILENLNHMTLDGDEARTVDEALTILGFVLYFSNTRLLIILVFPKGKTLLIDTRSDV